MSSPRFGRGMSPSSFHVQDALNQPLRSGRRTIEMPDFLQPGKPQRPLLRKMNFRRRLQVRVYNVLDRPSGVVEIGYHFIIFMLCLTCLIMSAISSPGPNMTPRLFTMEYVVVGVFWVEYLARLWSAGSMVRYNGIRGRLRFAGKTACIIDLFVVISLTAILSLNYSGEVFFTSAIRGIRFLQILRMLHVDRQGRSWRLLGSVTYSHRQELITSLYIGFLSLILFSYALYVAEKPEYKEGVDGFNHTNHSIILGYDNHFETYGDALWWGVVTVTTIGYGDYVPRTLLGKVIASCFSLLTIPFFALPAGILGSGFALKVQQQQREKKNNKKMPSAVKLIQASWRCFVTKSDSTMNATWRYYASQKKRLTDRDISSVAGLMSMSLIAGRSIRGNKLIFGKKHVSMPMAEKICVRGVRVLLFLLRKKEFRRCREPCDAAEIFEQCSRGNNDVTLKLKQLERRMEQTLGSPQEFAKGDVKRGRSTVCDRMKRLQQKCDEIEAKLDELLRRFVSNAQNRISKRDSVSFRKMS